MSEWRTIVTDSESMTGIAPVCPNQMDPTGLHHMPDDNAQDTSGVYDCCPHPHIEIWHEGDAKSITNRLTACGAEVCS